MSSFGCLVSGGMRRAAAAWRCGVLVCALAVLAACGAAVTLLVQVRGLPSAGGVDLVITAKLDGKPAMETLRLSPPQDLSRFGIELPGGTRGALALEASAFDRDGCAVAAGSAQVSLDGAARTDTQLTLSALTPRRCDTQAPCGEGALCTFSPQPQTQQLWATSAASPTDAWAVGAGGTVVHYDGNAWTTVATGDTATLYGVWASGPKDVWAVGAGGRILHYDGTTWAQVPSGVTADLNAIAGRAGDIWAVGDAPDSGGPGIVLRYDGNKWSQVSIPVAYGGSLFAVWLPAGSPNVYLSGEAGLLLRFTTAWARVLTGTTRNLYALWGPPAQPTRVYAAGANGELLRYTQGASPAIVDTTIGTADLFGLWGASGQALYAAGTGGSVYAIEGGTLSATPLASGLVASLRAVIVSDAGSGFVVGDHGAILRLAAGALTSMVGPLSTLRAVWGADRSDAWAVGDGGVSLHSTGTGWARVPTGTLGNLSSLWGSGPADLWATVEGTRTLLHYDGRAWSQIQYPGTDVLSFRAVAGAGPGTVWLTASAPLASPVLVRYTAGAWSLQPLQGPGTAYGLWVAASDPPDVWAIATDRRIDHVEGTVVTSYPVAEDLRTIWGSTGTGTTDLWAAGQRGALLHYRAGERAWTAAASGTTQTLNALWGTGPADVWAVGDGGTALRFDGAAWRPLTTGTTDRLAGVWGGRLFDLWAVGDYGLTLRSQR